MTTFNILRRTPARRDLAAGDWKLYYQHDNEVSAVGTYARRCQAAPEYEWKLEEVVRTILMTTTTTEK